MKLGTVIGRVTLNVCAPALVGGRWLIVSPFTRAEYQKAPHSSPPISSDPSLVVYDNLGADVGQTIGYVDGREAAFPFDQPTPVDGLITALIDEIFYRPFSS